uniref:Dipeptidyl aminopeptidase/acylaminoacyl-peptidase-like protein n=1 Tax=Caulobacter sp. (strain K31) TaxID=366602 RepID=B0T9D5_CAUSK
MIGVLAALAVAAQPIPTPSSLVETVDLSTPVLSPDGKTVAFRQGRASLNSNLYELSWWTVPLDASTPPRMIADAGSALWNSSGGPVVEAAQWSSDSLWLYYRALKEQQVQVWRSDRRGGMGEPVTRDDGDVERFILKGDRLAYAVRATRSQILDAERAAYDQGVLIDATIDPSQNLFSAIEINGRMASQRFSGSWFQRSGILGDASQRIKAIDLTNLKPIDAQLEVPQDPSDRIDVFALEKSLGPASASPFGQVSVTWRPGGSAVQITNPDGSKLTCETPTCQAARPLWAAWRPGRAQVVFAARDASLGTALYLWTPARAETKTITLDAGTLDGGAFAQPCSVGIAKVVCVVADSLSPPRLEAIDLGSGGRTILAAPNGPPLSQDELVAERLSWKDTAGRRFTGVLLRPRRARHLPLFVNYYACAGYLRGGVGDQFPFMILAQAGIVSLCVNETRDDSGGQDSVADYEAGLAGVRAAIDDLADRGLIDPSKVGMGGLSFGSDVTLWVAAHSSLLAAASIASVQVGPAYYWLNGVAGRDTHEGLRRFWKLGRLDETPDRWKLVAPALHADQIKAPLLMQLPEQEFRPTIDLFAALSNSTTPVEFHVFAQEPHILTQPRHRLAAYARNVDWFRFWLQDYMDPSPGKADQYRRWEAMRSAQAAALAQPQTSSQDRTQDSTSAR